MQDLEALVRNVLLSVSLDVLFQEREGCLIGLNWVGQVVSVDLLGLLSQEGPDGFDARGTLHVLRIDELVQILLQFLSGGIFDIHHLKHFNKDSFESLHVPVLVDDLVDHSGLKDLMGLVGEKIHEVVHVVNGFGVLHVLSAPGWQKLLTEHGDEPVDVGVLGELDVLLGVGHAHLYFVHHGAKHGKHQGLFLPQISSLHFKIFKFLNDYNLNFTSQLLNL